MSRPYGNAGYSLLPLALALLWSPVASTQEAHQGRHYDARVEYNSNFRALQAATSQAETLRGLRANIHELSVETNDITGAVSSLSNQTGYLTTAAPGEPMAI